MSNHKTWHELVQPGPRAGSHARRRDGDFYQRAASFPTATRVFVDGTEFAERSRRDRRHVLTPQGRRLTTVPTKRTEDIITLRHGRTCYIAYPR